MASADRCGFLVLTAERFGLPARLPPVPPRAQKRAAGTYGGEGHEHALRRSGTSLPHAII